jgi:Transposase, Mutator family
LVLRRAPPHRRQRAGNSRNGRTGKKILTEESEIALSIPRNRAGTFELVPKGVTRLDGFDGKIVGLYARGLSVRDIQARQYDMYGTEVSPDLISRVTDAVLEEVKEWQSRPLEGVYPIVFFDAIRVKVRDEGLVRNKADYVAPAIDTDGQEHVLGLWIEQTEGARSFVVRRAPIAGGRIGFDLLAQNLPFQGKCDHEDLSLFLVPHTVLVERRHDVVGHGKILLLADVHPSVGGHHVFAGILLRPARARADKFRDKPDELGSVGFDETCLYRTVPGVIVENIGRDLTDLLFAAEAFVEA